MAVLKYRAPDGTYHPVSYGSPSDLYLEVSGGTLTGPLLLDTDPVDPLGAAPRRYVDRRNPLADLRVAGTAISTTQITISYTSPFPATNDPSLWNAAEPTVLQCPWSGVYRLEGAFRFDALTTGANVGVYAAIEVKINGDRWFLPQHAIKDAGAALCSFSSSRYCYAGDEVTMSVNGAGVAAGATVAGVSCVVWTYDGT